jgi:2-dehydropantoate 2-reductase
MRFVVIGAGSVGSFAGGSLAHAGFDVTFIGRGAHVRAIAERGLEVHGTRDHFHVRVPSAETVSRMKTPDVALVTVKAHHLESLAGELRALAKSGCAIVTLQNGVPFWYFQGFGGKFEGTRLRSVDPSGALADAIDVGAIVAGVVNTGTRIPSPGVVEQVGELGYALGEPSGEESQRVRDLVAAFSQAGLDAVLDRNIRRTIWIKLVGNAALNPVSALTRATAEQMVDDAATASVLREAMRELCAVGAALGLDMQMSIDDRLAATRGYGDQRTSMLQDLEAGRPLELEPIAGAAVEIAALAGVPIPVARTLYALTRLVEGQSKPRQRGT